MRQEGEPAEPEARGGALWSGGRHFRLEQGGGAVAPTVAQRLGGEPKARERRAQVGGVARDQLAEPACRSGPVSPIPQHVPEHVQRGGRGGIGWERLREPRQGFSRSEEHTSELQSRLHLVCRLLLEKKKNLKLDHSVHERLRSQRAMVKYE